jgi:hypothetical protein
MPHARPAWYHVRRLDRLSDCRLHRSLHPNRDRPRVQRRSSAANLIYVVPLPCVAGHIKKARSAGPDLCAPFPFLGCPRTRKGSQTEGLTMQCGAPAAPSRRPEKIPGRNRIGLVALNELVPGGRAPSPQPPSPHPADRPRSSAKGRGLPSCGTATPSQRVATRSSRAHRDRLSVSRRLVSWP